MTANLDREQYMSVRYGRNENSQPYGAASNRPPSNWGDSTNDFNSVNLNHNWVLGGNKLNEFIFQYADFLNDITARSLDPLADLPERRGHRPERATRRRARSRRSGSSGTTSRGTSPAWAASATTSRPA